MTFYERYLLSFFDYPEDLIKNIVGLYTLKSSLFNMW